METASEATIEVAPEGQLPIPESMRAALGIREGQKYEVRALEGGVLMFTPQHGRAATALRELRDSLTAQGASLDDMLTELRRQRETDAP